MGYLRTIGEVRRTAPADFPRMKIYKLQYTLEDGSSFLATVQAYDLNTAKGMMMGLVRGDGNTEVSKESVKGDFELLAEEEVAQEVIYFDELAPFG